MAFVVLTGAMCRTFPLGAAKSPSSKAKPEKVDGAVPKLTGSSSNTGFVSPGLPKEEPPHAVKPGKVPVLPEFWKTPPPLQLPKGFFVL